MTCLTLNTVTGKRRGVIVLLITAIAKIWPCGENKCSDITLLHTDFINMWLLCAVVSSMSSLTSWTEEGFHPVGGPDEVWYSGLYHPPQPVLYGKQIYVDHTMDYYLETGRHHRQVDNFSYLSHTVCQYNIQAYPTTVIFNGSSVHEYEGQHSADGILEFIQVLHTNTT